ncbi:uncharacterized protein PFL1_01185 [Pseudozyma flocculosa PF-1]|uniref:uncharacterized protein n=1 Tax=Pseudozyma flocculosa PF-1 TaxID=1277687 RepID=UPI0004561BC4|nr:uncharacterized protein PFL1_01185 [Pseudozyma flocculosa PF-1]EPQ30996.1 hypothetical protein PFL1_01185 [Pseudozyma flocculosa PF-1]
MLDATPAYPPLYRRPLLQAEPIPLPFDPDGCSGRHSRGGPLPPPPPLLLLSTCRSRLESPPELKARDPPSPVRVGTLSAAACRPAFWRARDPHTLDKRLGSASSAFMRARIRLRRAPRPGMPLAALACREARGLPPSLPVSPFSRSTDAVNSGGEGSREQGGGGGGWPIDPRPPSVRAPAPAPAALGPLARAGRRSQPLALPVDPSC